MISSLHSLFDDRIYWKQAVSLKRRGFNVVHLGIGREKTDHISDEGVRIISIPRPSFTGKAFPDMMIKRIPGIKDEYDHILEKAKQINAQVYHLHDLQLARVIKKLKCLHHAPRVIYDIHEPYPITIHDEESNNLITSLLRKLYSRYIEKWEPKHAAFADQIITTEENVNNRFSEIFPDKKVDVVYNYCNLSIHDFEDISPAKKYDFIYAGVSRRRRGALQTLQAIKELKDRGLNPVLLVLGPIMGKGLMREMQDFIKINHLDSNIILRESVPYNDVMYCYLQSKCGVALFNDLKVNQTIMPIKIFEYIAFGLPVVCSDIGHMGAITGKYTTGMVVDPAKPRDVADAMEKLLTDAAFYKQCRTNCIDLFQSRFNWKFMERRLYSIYDDLLYNKKEKS